MDKNDFEDFLVERNDELDNAAHALAVLLLSVNDSPPDESEFPWNVAIIEAILESTENILTDHGHVVCWPYHANEIPCCNTDSCEFKRCPLKQKEAMTNE